MELLILALVAIGAIETTYLVYKSRPHTTVDMHSLLMDTSVLIDGRILPIARSGLLTAPLIIPRSVVRELQYMADKADHDKRERARAGLDMIDQLQHLEEVTVRLIDDPELTDGGVDERLVELAQKYNARLCTIDYNLNKAARVQGVTVVNINELAHALRIIHLPGEVVELKLVQAGQEARQAVGYLDDGTMVVVDDAKGNINQTVRVEVTRVLQTTAGKMMFARKVSGKKPEQKGDDLSGKTSQKFSGQTTSKASMGAGRNSRQTSKNDSMQSTNEVNTPTGPDASGQQDRATTNVQTTADAVQPTNEAALVTPRPTERVSRNRVFTTKQSRDTPRTNTAAPSITGAQNSSTQPSTTARPQQRKNPRRRKTPEDSFLDELTRQQ